jgi:hypothetical protein
MLELSYQTKFVWLFAFAPCSLPAHHRFLLAVRSAHPTFPMRRPPGPSIRPNQTKSDLIQPKTFFPRFKTVNFVLDLLPLLCKTLEPSAPPQTPELQTKPRFSGTGCQPVGETGCQPVMFPLPTPSRPTPPSRHENLKTVNFRSYLQDRRQRA